MKIIVTADLHYPTTTWNTITRFAARIAKQKPDVVVLAGDIGESVVSHVYFLKVIKEFVAACAPAPVLVISGNHDLWVDENALADEDSNFLWTRGLKEMTEQAGAFWLEGQNFIKDGIAVVGSMLHYDFSCRDKVGPTASLPTAYFTANKKRIINDGRFFKGLPDDIEFAKKIGEDFRARLQLAEDDPSIKCIAVVTHVPCMEELITRRPHDYRWAEATPFFGNLSHESLIKRCSKVRYVISAHSHCSQKAEIKVPLNGGYRKIIAKVVPSDYGSPQSVSLDLP